MVNNHADFPEKAYLEANDDVAAAVARGEFESGWRHYILYGRAEGRRLPVAPLIGERQIFHCHIPKTAGTMVRASLEGVFAKHEIMPDEHMMSRNGGRYPKLSLFISMLRAQIDSVRLVRGHYPLAVRELLPNCITIVVLRDPVSRSVSHLRHMIRQGFAERDDVLASLDAGDFPAASDLQTRFLSSSVDHRILEDAQSSDWGMKRKVWPTLEPDALSKALAALQTIDILGIVENMGNFRDRLFHATGIQVNEAHANVATVELTLTEGRIETIRRHNENDIRLYREARKLLASTN